MAHSREAIAVKDQDAGLGASFIFAIGDLNNKSYSVKKFYFDWIYFADEIVVWNGALL